MQFLLLWHFYILGATLFCGMIHSGTHIKVALGNS